MIEELEPCPCRDLSYYRCNDLQMKRFARGRVYKEKKKWNGRLLCVILAWLSYPRAHQVCLYDTLIMTDMVHTVQISYNKYMHNLSSQRQLLVACGGFLSDYSTRKQCMFFCPTQMLVHLGFAITKWLIGMFRVLETDNTMLADKTTCSNNTTNN